MSKSESDNVMNGFLQDNEAQSPSATERDHLHFLNKQFANIIDNNDAKMAIAETEIMNMKQVLREEIDATKNKIMKGEDELRKDLRGCEEENDRLQIELKKYRELYEMDRRTREEMRQEIADLRAALEERDEYKAELFTLKQELHRLREALSNAEVDKKALREEINAIEKIHEQQLLLFKFKDAAISDIRQNYENNMERMNHELHKKDQEISKLQCQVRTYTEKERTWESWDCERKTLEAKNATLRSRLSEKTESDNSLELSFEPEIKQYETLLQKVSNRITTPEKKKPSAPETAPKPSPKPTFNVDTPPADSATETPSGDHGRSRSCSAYKEKFNGNIKICSASRDFVALQNVGTKVWSKGKRPRTPSINDIEAGDVKYWAEGDNVVIKLKSSKGEEKAILYPIKEDGE